MNQTIDTTTSIGTLIIVAALAWWLMVPTAEPVVEPEPVVIEQEEAGSPGSVFQVGALAREGRALVNRANTTLDRFEREGVIVKPREPAPVAVACTPAGYATVAQAPAYQYVQPRRRLLFRRRR